MGKIGRATITVRGMGLIIQPEVLLIKRLLEQHGIPFEVEDDHPAEGEPAEADIVEAIRAKDVPVRLIADHEPWPG